MPDLDSKKRGPGFQRSETSSAELHIYAQPTDPVLSLRNVGAGKELLFDGRKITDQNPSLLAMSTVKEMGSPEGSWVATVKSGNPFNRREDLRDLITDDAWVDIHFSRHNRRFFTMRGMVDEVRRAGEVSGEGVTTALYTITGRDFGKVWSLTPIWFNKYIDSDNPPENVAGAAAMRVFTSLGLGGSVTDVIQKYLFGFLEELVNVGRANWQLPADMKGIGETAFIKNIDTDVSKFTNTPPRVAIAANFLDPDGANAWAMAQEWGDPVFVELFTDLIGSASTFNNSEDQFLSDNATMAIIIRDRPFPTVELGINSPWFGLPTVEVPREDIVNDDLGRGGTERFNAFFVSPQVLQEFMGSSAIEVTAPLWDKDDMLQHGFRRFDINSRYTLDVIQAGASATEDSLLTLTKLQRAQVRDWYCMNPYLYNGPIKTARGVLNARIGKRLKIPGLIPEEDFTAYIESVGHDWVFGESIKTTLGLTRGWFGTDDEYLRALQRLVARYGGNRQGDSIPPPAGLA